MEDVQNRRDHREIDIDKVGVRDLRYPIVVLDRENEMQHTVAHISMSVSLPHHFKGTHMSRFLEVLNMHRGEVTMRTLPDILHELKERLEAESAHMEVQFPFFRERTAPVSGAKSLLDYECSFVGESNGSSDDFVLGVRVPVTSLCPCSKEISDYGAHSQRSHVLIEVKSLEESRLEENFIWFEELIEVAEESASAPLYPLLKRPDERHVTMQAYENPAFVEDIVRNVAGRLREDERIAWFRVSSVNEESIHNHNAFAEIEWRRDND
jgi:GTP cyclohydrolase IB